MNLNRYKLLERMMSGLDTDDFDRLLEKPHSSSIEKYVDNVPSNCLDAIRYTEEAGIFQAFGGNGLRVLDISTGPGWFPYACQCLGHDPYFTFHDCTGHEIMADCRDLLGLKDGLHLSYVNNEFRPIPFDIKFDLISALHCPPMTTWKAREWGQFFADAMANLNNNGRVVLIMNRQPDPTVGSVPMYESAMKFGTVIKRDTDSITVWKP